jgi:hypothetical protein
VFIPTAKPALEDDIKIDLREFERLCTKWNKKFEQWCETTDCQPDSYALGTFCDSHSTLHQSERQRLFTMANIGYGMAHPQQFDDSVTTVVDDSETTVVDDSETIVMNGEEFVVNDEEVDFVDAGDTFIVEMDPLYNPTPMDHPDTVHYPLPASTLASTPTSTLASTPASTPATDKRSKSRSHKKKTSTPVPSVVRPSAGTDIRPEAQRRPETQRRAHHAKRTDAPATA